MSLRAISLKLPAVSRKEILWAVLLGLTGFLLNTLELPLGWGVHFIFGNALIFAFIRVLAPQMLVLGISISSVWTIFLWNHPWAWLVWVCEAIFVAYGAKSNAPVRRDLIFWLVLGTPLMLLTCGLVMDMDGLSLLLVIAKQSANGILNVVLGELLYVTLIGTNPFRKFGHWPKLKTQSAVITLLMAIILIPTIVYLAIDAPYREQAARNEVSTSLEYRLALSSASLNNWVQSRSLILRMHAADEMEEQGVPKPHLLDDLSPDFENIVTSGQGRRIEWWAPENKKYGDIVDRQPSLSAGPAQSGVRLVNMAPRRTKTNPQFKLIVPFEENGQAGVIEAQLRAGALQNLTKTRTGDQDYNIFLVSAEHGASSLTNASEDLLIKAQSVSSAQQMESLRSPVLLSNIGYGSSVMSDLRNAFIMRSTIVAELPEWRVVGIAPLAPAVNVARQIQLKQLFALMGLCMIVAIIATIVGRRMTQTLRKLSESAADLSAAGIASYANNGLILDEVNDIVGQIATAGQKVGRERGALASFRRRVNGIARHAPVIVYAVDVTDRGRGKFFYVSESLEKILGFTAADLVEPGFWSRGIYADDLASCWAAFGNLSANKVVSVEYRVQHKQGHYVWVYDSLSVETNPHTGQLEAVGVIMDISERKAAAEQLLQADKMASLGRMISGTAHELNQPLNFIKMAASNLRENTARGRMDAEQFLPKLANILGQVERASAILLQMRIFGRTPKEMPYPVDVKASVEAVVTMVAPQFEFDGTQVITQEKSGPVHVQALPMLLEQVLLNLLLNANDAIQTRYGPDDAAQGRIKITVERRNQLAVINVEDNGTGITPDALRKIFDPFFTTKPPKEGTGLGLSISYGIIRDLGGVIRARSSQTGARFTIELPLVENKAA